jgi:hypothetical protein
MGLEKDHPKLARDHPKLARDHPKSMQKVLPLMLKVQVFLWPTFLLATVRVPRQKRMT